MLRATDRGYRQCVSSQAHGRGVCQVSGVCHIFLMVSLGAHASHFIYLGSAALNNPIMYQQKHIFIY